MLSDFVIEIKSCTPNPCQHNGICKIVNNNFECDCNGTFYRGKICEKGAIVVPEIPILFISQTRFNLKIQGHSDNHIKVSLILSPEALIEPTK